jgi:hypothetical protein
VYIDIIGPFDSKRFGHREDKELIMATESFDHLELIQIRSA